MTRWRLFGSVSGEPPGYVTTLRRWRTNPTGNGCHKTLSVMWGKMTLVAIPWHPQGVPLHITARVWVGNVDPGTHQGCHYISSPRLTMKCSDTPCGYQVYTYQRHV
ncbi:MAG: hypothetical protein ACJ8CB_01075 [Ktedonobacteraceae bacterium]